MLHNVFTSYKWLIGSVVFLILITVAFVIWQHYDLKSFNKRHSISDVPVEQKVISKKTEPKVSTQQTIDASAENKALTVEHPATESNVPDKVTDNNEEIPTTVRFSRYGFGPYPEVPKEWNYPNLWENIRDRNHELLQRVSVKMWNEGRRWSSIGMEADGLITVVEPGTVIVQWETARDGTRRIWRALGDPKDISAGVYTSLSDFPSHLNIVNREDVAIDPYEYLGIEK